MARPTRILIIDDSAVVRATLEEIFNAEPDLEVMGKAANPYDAAALLANAIPDVITLDLEMPRMDGLTFLKQLMAQHPLPVVVCSSLAQRGAEAALAALELGAVEVIAKPTLGTYEFLVESRSLLCDAVRAAAQARPRLGIHNSKPDRPRAKTLVSEYMPDVTAHELLETTDKLIVVGASTGGTEALRVLLHDMPLDCPGILVVQHMPANFTASFAQRLDQICRISVKEARDGDPIAHGQALIAPGGLHMLLKRNGARYAVQIKEGPLVNRHRPSVDVLFRSAAHHAGANATAIIMTGMGDDGAQGCLDLKSAGATVIAQDEASCVVFGMPKCAIARGAVHQVLPLSRLAEAAINAFRPRHKRDLAQKLPLYP